MIEEHPYGNDGKEKTLIYDAPTVEIPENEGYAEEHDAAGVLLHHQVSETENVEESRKSSEDERKTASAVYRRDAADWGSYREPGAAPAAEQILIRAFATAGRTDALPGIAVVDCVGTV